MITPPVSTPPALLVYHHYLKTDPLPVQAKAKPAAPCAACCRLAGSSWLAISPYTCRARTEQYLPLISGGELLIPLVKGWFFVPQDHRCKIIKRRLLFVSCAHQ